MKKLYNLFFVDHRSWLSMHLIAIVCSVSIGTFSLMSGLSVRDCALQVVLVALLSLVVYITVYYLKPQQRSLQIPSRSFLDFFPRRAVLAGALVSLAVLLGLSTGQLEAAILERKLRRLMSQQPLNQTSIDEISATFKQAQSSNIKLPVRTINSVKHSLRETAESRKSLASVATQVGAEIAAYSTIIVPHEIAQALSDRNRHTAAIGSKFSFQPIATNTGPNNYLTVSVSRQPNVARMERLDKPLVIGGEYGPSFLIVQDLTATLDGFKLKRIIFNKMKLIYNGGPLVLEQVYFFECEFEFAVGSNPWELINAIKVGERVDFSINEG